MAAAAAAAAAGGTTPPPAAAAAGGTTPAPAAPRGGASAASSLASLINSSIGAGILSMAYAMSCAGWAGGLLALVATASAEGGTLWALASMAEGTGTTSYSTLVAAVLGPGAAALLSLALLAYSFGSCVAYLLIIGDCLVPPLRQAFGAAGWWANREAVISAFGVACILPLCFPTRLDAISGASGLKVAALAVVTGAVALRSLQLVALPGHSWAGLRAFNASPRALQALNIMVFGFQCHTAVLSVFHELEARPSLRRSARDLLALLGRSSGSRGEPSTSPAAAPTEESPGPSPSEQQQQHQEWYGLNGHAHPGDDDAEAPASGYERLPQLVYSRSMRSLKSSKLMGMASVVVAAVSVTALFYALVGLGPNLAFPSGVASNVLNQFPADDAVIQVARVLMGLAQLASFPINHFPARLAVCDLLESATGRALGPAASRAFNACETLVFFGGALALALVVTDLGMVFQLIGGSCGVAIVFAFPGALLVAHSRAKQEQAARAASEGLAPLLEGSPPQARRRPRQPRVPPPYRCYTSRRWWSGVALLALSACLFVLTIHTVLWPPA